MNDHDPESRELVESIRDAWSPEPVDVAGFDARLRQRLRVSQRRRAMLVAGLAAAAVLVVVSQLWGGSPVEPSGRVLPTDQAPAEAPLDPERALVDASPDAEWFAGALEPSQRAFDLPGAYGALDALFLQPIDQEL